MATSIATRATPSEAGCRAWLRRLNFVGAFLSSEGGGDDRQGHRRSRRRHPRDHPRRPARRDPLEPVDLVAGDPVVLLARPHRRGRRGRGGGRGLRRRSRSTACWSGARAGRAGAGPRARGSGNRRLHVYRRIRRRDPDETGEASASARSKRVARRALAAPLPEIRCRHALGGVQSATDLRRSATTRRTPASYRVHRRRKSPRRTPPCSVAVHRTQQPRGASSSGQDDSVRELESRTSHGHRDRCSAAVDERVELPRLGHALQTMNAASLQVDARAGDQVAHGP